MYIGVAMVTIIVMVTAHCHGYYRLFTDTGLPYLVKEFPKLKFKGKGHEVGVVSFDQRNNGYHGNI